MGTKHIKSIKTLLNNLPKVEDIDNQLYFRGHADISYKLRPSIYREKKWICNENRMIQDFLLTCPSEFSNTNSTFDKLVKMQHYDFPTRLLDITSNALVALYFACISQEQKDGELIVFNIPKNKIKYSESDTVSVIANISNMGSNFDIKCQENFLTYKSEVYQQQYLHFINREKPYFLDKILIEDMQKVLCVKPKLNNNRIIRQDGAFLLFGMKNKKRDCAEIPSDYRFQDTKLKIPKGSKSNLLEELEVLGITTAKLFPELDSVAKYIKGSNKYVETDYQDINDSNDWWL
ncbi:FRG domain-containing protein [Pseudoalteromonas fuliginea]|uniref:FRG domain-containing protein n=1 Tax=Pseudoalteromonas fuliginea TaxID=1872678 RepID=UPI0031760383